MPQDKLSMRKIRDVLRYRHSTELSLEAIARALNISKGVVLTSGVGPAQCFDLKLFGALNQGENALSAAFSGPKLTR